MASWFIFYSFYFREKETDNSKTESVHLAHVATLDRDDLSLVSYNSIRDCSVSATPKTVSVSEPCHIGQLPQAISEELKVKSHKQTSVVLAVFNLVYTFMHTRNAFKSTFAGPKGLANYQFW